MASLSFLGRVFVAGMSGAALVACTSALGNFTIDDKLDGGSGTAGKEGGSNQSDGGSAADGGGEGTDSGTIGTVDAGLRQPCTKDGKFVFVTKEDVLGNFAAGTMGNPINEADGRCQAAAMGKLPGTYHAWLSTGAPSEYSPGSLPATALFLPKCIQVKQSGSAGGGKLMNPIDEDQNGDPVGPAPAWTATTSQGSLPGGGSIASTTCGNWLLSAGSGVVGNIGATDDTWSDNNSPIPCTNKAHFYCIEQ